MKYIVMICIILTIIGCIDIIKVNNDIVFAEQNNLIISSASRLKVRLYVFNDDTNTWDRAREETVKNIACDKLRGFGLMSGGEYMIEVEK